MDLETISCGLSVNDVWRSSCLLHKVIAVLCRHLHWLIPLLCLIIMFQLLCFVCRHVCVPVSYVFWCCVSCCVLSVDMFVFQPVLNVMLCVSWWPLSVDMFVFQPVLNVMLCVSCCALSVDMFVFQSVMCFDAVCQLLCFVCRHVLSSSQSWVWCCVSVVDLCL